MVPAQQDTDEASRLNMATPSATGTRGDQFAGKRPIASLFPGIPVTQASADAEASATERAPRRLPGEPVTAMPLPSWGQKLKSLCSVSRKGLRNTVCAFVQNRQSSCRAQQQQQHATVSVSSSHRFRSSENDKDVRAADHRSKLFGHVQTDVRGCNDTFPVREIPSTGLQRVSTSQEPQRTWSVEQTERARKSLCSQYRRASPAQEHTVDRR